jgi:Plasmodium falciparum domain of unknown function (CPW_WPC)
MELRYEIATTIEFAEQTISIPPNTLKCTLTIENWSFSCPLNYLMVNAKICVSLANTSYNAAQQCDSGLLFGNYTNTEGVIEIQSSMQLVAQQYDLYVSLSKGIV